MMIKLNSRQLRHFKWCLLVVFFISQNAFSQNVKQPLTGTVVDEKGIPIPGVSINEKGTINSTQTNLNGNFTFSNLKSNSSLLFTFLGYQPQEVQVNGNSNLKVSLTPSTNSLNEVVVVGYGSQRKVATTGSIASVKADELTQTPITNVAQGLQSRVSGVQITQNSAAPGGNISVRIRGINSINGTSEPLYVIDGVQVVNSGGITDVSPLSTINPEDIESVDVLKDASSTAIYGSRGANGVILITTKRGKNGVTRVSLDSYYGVQQITKTLKMMNATQFAKVENQVFNRQVFTNPDSLGDGTDWQSLIFRTAPIFSSQLSINGGNENTQVSISGNYMKQDGIVIKSDFTRYSFRANVDHKISNTFKVGTSIFSSYSINNSVPYATGDVNSFNSVIETALSTPPVLQVYDSSGKLYPFADQLNGLYAESGNVFNQLNIKNSTALKRTLVNVYGEAKILPNLTYRASINTDIQNSLNDYYSPRSNVSKGNLGPLSGNASKTNTNSLLLLHESVLTYNQKFENPNHSLKITGVYATQSNNFNSNQANANGFPNDITQDEALQLGLTASVNSNRTSYNINSFLGRINYGYKDKYFLDLTGREDGSSVFGAKHKYGFFPAIGAAWRIIEEQFLKNQNFLSDLKLRVTYGKTGNAGALGPYQSLSLVGPGGSFNYEFNRAYNIGIAPNGVVNPDLRWEQSLQTDIGVDLGFIKNRFTIVVDAYNKSTSGLIYNQQLPLSSGYQSINGNFAEIQNKGIEVNASAQILTGSLKWSMNGNISFNRNKVISIVGGVNEVFVSPYSVVKVGEPLGVFKTFVFDGIYQTGETILPGSASKTGGTKLRDINNDGAITGADQVVTGNPNPDFIYGFSTNLAFKSFDFSAFFSGIQGNKIFNLTPYYYESPSGGRNTFAAFGNNYWSPTNPSNEYISPVSNQSQRLPISSRFVEDGSFLRCKNITAGYRLPKIKGIYSARVYVSANNLFTVTKYSGYDPEVNSFGGSNTSIGIDNIVYPQSRSFLGGLQVTF